MNESSVSSAFQTKLRQALPGAVVIKHADKSMIGMVDASVTFNNKTVWMEYKCIKPATKGVAWRKFMETGAWEPLAVASASPTQFEFAKSLAKAGRCVYLFWVLDHDAIRMRIKHVVMWHPIWHMELVLPNTDVVVECLRDLLMGGGNHEFWLP